MSAVQLDGSVPASRVRSVGDHPVRAGGRYVLYWMIAARRTRFSSALARARAWAAELGKPLLVFEPLRAGYRWAADRHHVFVLHGMADQADACQAAGVRYLPYVEPEAGAGKGLLAALAEHAAVTVTDDYPSFFIPRMIEAAGQRLSCRVEAVDGNGLLPMRATDKVFTRAHSLRAYLQRELPAHLDALPPIDPLAGYDLGTARVPQAVVKRWPMVTRAALRRPEAIAAALPIDHRVGPVAECPGGPKAGAQKLAAFMSDGIDRYGVDRNHPDEDGSSGLSPYLHYGHVGAHQMLFAMAEHEGWSPADLGAPLGGAKEGWWGMRSPAESFADQVFTWREIGFNFCAHRQDYARFESLPPWALKTMAEHAGDVRPQLYDFDVLEEARTSDEIWNAAQRQLRSEGKIHNYLRMLWGKKIYEWSKSGEQALSRMIALNDKWCLDGRDPNSYSGIGWVLGRYDRAWGPEREIFGKLRYMTSDSTRKKLRLRKYLARFGGQASLL